MGYAKSLNQILKFLVLIGVFASGKAETISGSISFLSVTNCCAEGLGSNDGMVKVQLDNQAAKTAYILPSAKNYNQMLSLMFVAQSTSQIITIEAGLLNGQYTISDSQKGGLFLGVRY